MAHPKGTKPDGARTLEQSVEDRRARMMRLAVEGGKCGPDLEKFFAQCLRAHAIDTLKELE